MNAEPQVEAAGGPVTRQTWDRPSGWRDYVFPGLWLIYLGQTVDGLGRHNDVAGLLLGLAGLLVFAALYLIALNVAVPFHRRVGWWFIAALIVLTVLEAVLAHGSANAMLVYIAVLIVGVTEFDEDARPRVIAVLLVAALAAFGPWLVPAWHSGVDWGTGFIVLLVAVAMFGFFGLIRSNRELAEARSEVARLAAENERTRIARDLHDLLGHSLTTITVKAGLARRLADRDPDRAAEEIAEVEELTRSSLADVRAAVSGYREVTLSGELASAGEVLRAAGVSAQLPGAVDVVDGDLRPLFGWVVREGVTNIVRHARAARATVTVGPNWVEIVDDGAAVLDARDAPTSSGHGLIGLRERVTAAGGTVHAGATGAGWRLRVDVPRAPSDRPIATPSPAVRA